MPAVAEPSRSTGFALLDSAGSDARERGHSLWRERRERQPGGFARVGAEDPEPTGIRDDGDAIAAWERLRGEEHGRVEKLFERAGAQHARLPEQRLDGGVGAREGGRVRGRSARSCAARPAPHGEDRLRAGDTARHAREFARVAERLEVEQHDVGVRIVLPVLEQVVRRDVGFVPDRDEARETKAASVRFLEERQTEGAALRRESDPAGGCTPASERRVQPRRIRRDSEAVRSDEPRSVRANQGEQLVLTLLPVGARLREAGGDDADRLHTCRERRADSVQRVRAGDADNGEIDDYGNVSDFRVARHTADGLATAVDRIRRAGEVAGEDVAKQLAADRAPPRRGSDHRD